MLLICTCKSFVLVTGLSKARKSVAGFFYVWRKFNNLKIIDAEVNVSHYSLHFAVR